MDFIDVVAWVLLKDGAALGARSRGKDTFYIPGGKREVGESDLQTLMREVKEELTVAIRPETVAHLGTYEAAAHGFPAGAVVRMACYTADFDGTLTPGGEIAEITWLGYADRDRTAPVDQVLFDDLHAAGLLR